MRLSTTVKALSLAGIIAAVGSYYLRNAYPSVPSSAPIVAYQPVSYQKKENLIKLGNRELVSTPSQKSDYSPEKDFSIRLGVRDKACLVIFEKKF